MASIILVLHLQYEFTANWGSLNKPARIDGAISSAM